MQGSSLDASLTELASGTGGGGEALDLPPLRYRLNRLPDNLDNPVQRRLRRWQRRGEAQRVTAGRRAIGGAQYALELMCKRAASRVAFGKALVEFQAMQFQLAEMATDIEAVRLLVYNAARLKDAKLDFLREAAMCKYFTSQVAERVASLAVEVFGGSGFVKDYPVEKLYRGAIAFYGKERIMLLGGSARKRLKPVGKVGYPSFFGPCLHAGCHLVGNAAVNT